MQGASFKFNLENKSIFRYEMGLVTFLLDEMKTYGRTLGMRVSFNDLIQVPKCMHPTGQGV